MNLLDILTRGGELVTSNIILGTSSRVLVDSGNVCEQNEMPITDENGIDTQSQSTVVLQSSRIESVLHRDSTDVNPGYYLCRYMWEIIENNVHDIPQMYFNGSPKTYYNDHLHELHKSDSSLWNLLFKNASTLTGLSSLVFHVDTIGKKCLLSFVKIYNLLSEQRTVETWFVY